MAALDFGMALARGMLPTSEKAQKDLLNLAGGRNVFKSEDWWQKQVDEQISSGYRKVKEQGREYLLPSGQYQLGRRDVNVLYRPPAPSGPFASYGGGGGSLYPSSPIAAIMGGWTAETRVSYQDPTGGKALSSRPVDVYEGRTYFTGGELSDIEAKAKAGAAKTKKELAASKASQKKLRRGTGGLMGKARLPGELPSTGLPELGSLGLGLEQGTLGGKVKL